MGYRNESKNQNIFSDHKSVYLQEMPAKLSVGRSLYIASDVAGDIQPMNIFVYVYNIPVDI